jgi:benzodiazapine receptor
MRASVTTPTYVVPIVAALGCLAALVIGGALTRPNLDWYATLQKPGFTPPNKEENHRLAIIWFFIQLVIGVLWSFAFFWLHSPALGLGVILAFLVAITITIVLFDRTSRLAAVLLMPLLLWVCFAAGLNFAILYLNS